VTALVFVIRAHTLIVQLQLSASQMPASIPQFIQTTGDSLRRHLPLLTLCATSVCL